MTQLWVGGDLIRRPLQLAPAIPARIPSSAILAGKYATWLLLLLELLLFELLFESFVVAVGPEMDAVEKAAPLRQEKQPIASDGHKIQMGAQRTSSKRRKETHFYLLFINQ